MTSTEYRIRETDLGHVVETRPAGHDAWRVCTDVDWTTRVERAGWRTAVEAADFLKRLRHAERVTALAGLIATNLRDRHPDWSEFIVAVQAQRLALETSDRMDREAA